jgi:hypothetical protein
MHTSFGVHGLHSYGAIQKWGPAPISAGAGARSGLFFAVYELEGVVVVPGHLVDRFSRTNGRFFKRRPPWRCGHGAHTAWLHAHSSWGTWYCSHRCRRRRRRRHCRIAGIGRCEVDSTGSQIRRRLNHANSTGPKAGAVCAVFASLGHWEPGVDVGGARGPGGPWGSVPTEVILCVSKKLKKRKKRSKSCSFCAMVSTVVH